MARRGVEFQSTCNTSKVPNSVLTPLTLGYGNLYEFLQFLLLRYPAMSGIIRKSIKKLKKKNIIFDKIKLKHLLLILCMNILI